MIKQWSNSGSTAVQPPSSTLVNPAPLWQRCASVETPAHQSPRELRRVHAKNKKNHVKHHQFESETSVGSSEFNDFHWVLVTFVHYISINSWETTKYRNLQASPNLPQVQQSPTRISTRYFVMSYSNVPCASAAPNMLPAVAALAALAALAAALLVIRKNWFRQIWFWFDRICGSKMAQFVLLPMAWYLSCCACWFLPERSQQLTRFNL